MSGTRIRYGYKRIYILLRREGWQVTYKRVYRLYKQEGLSLRFKRPKRRVRAQIRTYCEFLREANDAKTRSKFSGMLDEVTQLLNQCHQVEKDFEYQINKKYFR